MFRKNILSFHIQCRTSVVYTTADANLFLSIGDQLFFKQLLLEIRGITSKKTKSSRQWGKNLEEKIKTLEKLYDSDSSTEILEQ